MDISTATQGKQTEPKDAAALEKPGMPMHTDTHLTHRDQGRGLASFMTCFSSHMCTSILRHFKKKRSGIQSKTAAKTEV